MKKFLLLAPATLLMFSCGGEEATTEETTEEVVEEVVEPTTDEEITAYLEDNGWEATRDESGLYVVIDTLGTGDLRPTVMDSVEMFYQGYLLDGSQFDGTTDASVTFLLADLIQGWQIGIPYFGKGGKGKLVIPSDMAYGDMDRPGIPGGSTLMFEIELLDIIQATPAE